MCMLRVWARIFNTFAYSRANTNADDSDSESDMTPLDIQNISAPLNPLYGIQTRDPFETVPGHFPTYNLTNCELFEEDEGLTLTKLEAELE